MSEQETISNFLEKQKEKLKSEYIYLNEFQDIIEIKDLDRKTDILAIKCAFLYDMFIEIEENKK